MSITASKELFGQQPQLMSNERDSKIKYSMDRNIRIDPKFTVRGLWFDPNRRPGQCSKLIVVKRSKDFKQTYIDYLAPWAGGQILGFDMEWVNAKSYRLYITRRKYTDYPDLYKCNEALYKTAISGSPSMIQFSTLRGITVICRIALWKYLPVELVKILESKNVLKVGMNTQNDSDNLYRSFRIRLRATVNLDHFITMHPHLTQFGLKVKSLSGIGLHLFGLIVDKDRYRQSNWNAPRLSAEEIEYASLDSQLTIDAFFHCAPIVLNEWPISSMQQLDISIFQEEDEEKAENTELAQSDTISSSNDSLYVDLPTDIGYPMTPSETDNESNTEFDAINQQNLIDLFNLLSANERSNSNNLDLLNERLQQIFGQADTGQNSSSNCIDRTHIGNDQSVSVGSSQSTNNDIEHWSGYIYVPPKVDNILLGLVRSINRKSSIQKRAEKSSVQKLRLAMQHIIKLIKESNEGMIRIGFSRPPEPHKQKTIDAVKDMRRYDMVKRTHSDWSKSVFICTCDNKRDCQEFSDDQDAKEYEDYEQSTTVSKVVVQPVSRQHVNDQSEIEEEWTEWPDPDLYPCIDYNANQLEDSSDYESDNSINTRKERKVMRLPKRSERQRMREQMPVTKRKSVYDPIWKMWKKEPNRSACTSTSITPVCSNSQHETLISNEATYANQSEINNWYQEFQHSDNTIPCTDQTNIIKSVVRKSEKRILKMNNAQQQKQQQRQQSGVNGQKRLVPHTHPKGHRGGQKRRNFKKYLSSQSKQK